MVSKLLWSVGAAALLCVAAAGCDEGARDDVREAARGAAEQAVETAESSVGATLESKGEEVRSTAEAKGEELKGAADAKGEELRGTAEAKGDEFRPTVEAAATDVAVTLVSLKDVSDTLDGFPKAVLTALGTLGDQATALRKDNTLISDRAWLHETNEAIDVLGDRGADALSVADQLAADESLPAIQSSLREVGDMLVDTAAEFSEQVDAEDVDGFLRTTNRLALITTAIGIMQEIASFDR